MFFHSSCECAPRPDFALGLLGGGVTSLVTFSKLGKVKSSEHVEGRQRPKQWLTDGPIISLLRDPPLNATHETVTGSRHTPNALERLFHTAGAGCHSKTTLRGP
jgi:hypothetical protein